MSSDVAAQLRTPNSYALARRTLEAMETHKVWPTPLNFELWLHYVSGVDSPVSTEIAALVTSGVPFTEQVGERIAAAHLPAVRLNGEILEAGRNLSDELDNVSRAIVSARETNEAYERQLASASVSLETEGPENVRGTVETLSHATRKAREDQETLEGRLAETNDELGRLRTHLEQVRREAMTDALTNLANRKAFDEALEAACVGAGAAGGTVTLAMIDIDHFKKFNDTWGHQTGDQVIRYVASVISRMAEGRGIAARYGGEEFAVIFPNTAAEKILPIVEKAREEISSRVLKRRSTNDNLGAVTISTGLAQLSRGEAAVELLERSDGALYAAKRGGRNRTTMAAPGASKEIRAA